MSSLISNELRMYILMNSSAKMKPGKAISRAGHGISEMTEYLIKHKPIEWKIYSRNSHPKITLKCPEEELIDIYQRYKDRSRSVWCLDVKDQGRTQVPEGTMTALVFNPMKNIDVPKEINSLKLY